MELRGVLPDLPYYVDSPLSKKATEVLKDHPDEYNKEVKQMMRVDEDIFQFKGLKFIESVQESKNLNEDRRPCVIISSSGMAEAGRVKHHIKNNIGNERNTILTVGYSEPNSLAGRLVAGRSPVKIFGDEYDVKAEIKEIKSMSAHGDYEDLLKFLSCQDKDKIKGIFLVHGEYDTQTRFKQRLESAGYSNIRIPGQHQMEEI